MSLRQRGKLFRWLAALALFALAANAFAQSVVDRAKALLREGKAREAYELLEPAAGELNDAESSYLLGIAALDSGKSGLAVLAFERALGYDPTFAPARAELVRALIASGETDQARVELARLSPDQVPPQVREKLGALQRALAEAADVAQRRRSGLTAYIQGEAGYDSNINTGANSSTISIPLFGGATATLAQIFTKKGSAFAGLGAGGIAFHEVAPGLRLF
ncbi:MAG TPA: tetratricopeptide repeat protein, partial [Burkholderiales bacterium]